MRALENKYFDLQKKSTLAKVDLSRKGSIDEPIVPLVSYVNELNDYFTTSSCSGRIAVIDQPRKRVKKGCQWLFIAHEAVSLQQFLENLVGALETLPTTCVDETRGTLKFEPFIMHVQCRNMESAQNFQRIAVDSGLRNSGLTVGKSGKLTVAVRSVISMELPIIHNRKLIISEDYLKFVMEEVEEKFVENNILIAKFSEFLKAIVSD